MNDAFVYKATFTYPAKCRYRQRVTCLYAVEGCCVYKRGLGRNEGAATLSLTKKGIFMVQIANMLTQYIDTYQPL